MNPSTAYYTLLGNTHEVIKVIYPGGYTVVGKLVGVVLLSGILSLTLSPLDYFGNITINNTEFHEVIINGTSIKGVD